MRIASIIVMVVRMDVGVLELPTELAATASVVPEVDDSQIECVVESVAIPEPEKVLVLALVVVGASAGRLEEARRTVAVVSALVATVVVAEAAAVVLDPTTAAAEARVVVNRGTAATEVMEVPSDEDALVKDVVAALNEPVVLPVTARVPAVVVLADVTVVALPTEDAAAASVLVVVGLGA